MKNKTLKIARILFAILLFIPILCYFIDFSGKFPEKLQTILHIQLIPAIISGMLLAVVIILAFTWLFGRIYCSALCPAGVLQDIFIRLSGKSKKKKKRGSKKSFFSFHKPANILRYGILLVTILIFLVGSNQLVTFLDPYSNFGRISANIFQPIVIGINNLLALILLKMDNYSLFYISIHNITLISIIAAFLILALFAVLSIFRGRLFCNTLCPVGGLLSLFSRYSLFRITFNQEKCNQCGLCERSCKSECINSKEHFVDTSRCVNCFNCIPSCTKGALTYQPSLFSSREKTATKTVEKKDIRDSKRSFIATGAGIIASIPLLQSCTGGKNKYNRQPNPIVPPGGISQEVFAEKCTACHLCVVKCPSKIIKPTGMEYGFDYFLKPHLSYEKLFCNYECTVCTDVCPNHALHPLSPDEKKTTQLGIVHFEEDLCVVKTEEKDCGACSEHCPTQAVKMVSYKGDLRIPHIEPDICVGCGGCEYICPVRPQRAIYVVANTEHKKVKKPEYEKVKDVEVTDFGF